MPQNVCPQCRKQFYSKNSVQIYCSTACYNKARFGFDTRICQTCNKSFSVRKTVIRQGGGKYCSYPCFYRRSQKTVKLTRACPVCGRTFETFPSMLCTHCSIECYEQSRERNTEVCEICGKTFEAAPASKRRFCSRRCMAENMRVPGSDRCEYVGFTESLKEKIRKRDNRTCQLCGKSEANNARLDVHHINYQKSDDQESNLISLCHSCHSSTHHKRGYWMQYFQNMLVS